LFVYGNPKGRLGVIMGWKEKAKSLFPWEDEKRKKRATKGHGIPPKTGLTARIRSRPKARGGQEYLDMYLMTKERDRWQKYGESLAKSLEKAADGWRVITAEIWRRGAKPDKPTEKGDGHSNNRQNKELATPPPNRKTVDWPY
jgi:hypothetical protein